MTALDKLIEAYDSATDDSKCADVTYFGNARLAVMENARQEQTKFVAALQAINESYGEIDAALAVAIDDARDSTVTISTSEAKAVELRAALDACRKLRFPSPATKP